jgi:hypothetical protein
VSGRGPQPGENGALDRLLPVEAGVALLLDRLAQRSYASHPRLRGAQLVTSQRRAATMAIKPKAVIARDWPRER